MTHYNGLILVPYLYSSDFHQLYIQLGVFMSLVMPTSLTLNNIAALSSAVVTVAPAQSSDTNALRSVVTALASGTAANVRFHAVSDVFDITSWTPKNVRSLPAANQNGVRPQIPVNSYAIVIRKGLKAASDVASQPSPLTIKWDVPAGAESYDAANLAALIATAGAFLTAKAASMYDNSLTGSN